MIPNKHFNTYKEGLDLELLREYCIRHGEVRTFLRGEAFEDVGEPAQWVAYVERGCFKYMVHNKEEEKDYCTGFAFEGEFVADYPNCLSGEMSEVTIIAGTIKSLLLFASRSPRYTSPSVGTSSPSSTRIFRLAFIRRCDPFTLF